MSLDVSLYFEVDVGSRVDQHFVYDANITHNLRLMAQEAGCYVACWRPEEAGYKSAEDLIIPLKDSLDMLLSFPEKFKGMNPSNGWGNYEGLCSFVLGYLLACREYPKALIDVS